MSAQLHIVLGAQNGTRSGRGNDLVSVVEVRARIAAVQELDLAIPRRHHDRPDRLPGQRDERNSKSWGRILIGLQELVQPSCDVFVNRFIDGAIS